jgi:GT2 family glycosyltransferase
MSRVTCITVAYGPTPTLSSTIEALVRHQGDETQGIVVVTQPDSHGRRAQLGTLGDRVQHLCLDENLGFGPANNLAVERCDSEFLAFVNPDLVVTEGWLGPLVRALDDPMVAIAAPPLLDGEGRLAEAGQAVFSDGGTEAVGGPKWSIEGDPEGYDSVMFDRDVDYSSAACWVMRREVFLALGGFDPRYAPAYFEDSDLAMTAWNRGLATRLVVDRPVVHHHVEADAASAALARSSRRQFEQKWSEQLRRQPQRSTLERDRRSVRDHRSIRRIAYIFDGVSDSVDMERAAEAAATEAAANPRDRVTLVVPCGTTVGRLRRRHRTKGLEVIAVKSIRHVDLSWASEVRKAGR